MAGILAPECTRQSVSLAFLAAMPCRITVWCGLVAVLKRICPFWAPFGVPWRPLLCVWGRFSLAILALLTALRWESELRDPFVCLLGALWLAFWLFGSLLTPSGPLLSTFWCLGPPFWGHAVASFCVFRWFCSILSPLSCWYLRFDPTSGLFGCYEFSLCLTCRCRIILVTMLLLYDCLEACTIKKQYFYYLLNSHTPYD